MPRNLLINFLLQARLGNQNVAYLELKAGVGRDKIGFVEICRGKQAAADGL